MPKVNAMLQITQSERVNEKWVPRAEPEDSRVTGKSRFWNMSRILFYNRILYMYVCSAASVWARLNQGFSPAVYTHVCQGVGMCLGLKDEYPKLLLWRGGKIKGLETNWWNTEKKKKENYVHRRWFSHSQSSVESPSSFFDGFIICLLLSCSPVLQRSHTSFVSADIPADSTRIS